MFTTPTFTGRTLIALSFFCANFTFAERWVDVGADTEAKYYLDLDSIEVKDENLNVVKKGVYTRTMTDDFEGRGEPVVFKVTKALVEIDCARGLNRVVKIDMVDERDTIVWSSGYMERRLWLTIKDQGHARTTFDLACAQP